MCVMVLGDLYRCGTAGEGGLIACTYLTQQYQTGHRLDSQYTAYCHDVKWAQIYL